MEQEELAAQLEMIASIAKVAAIEVRKGHHWQGELSQQIAKIINTLDKCKSSIAKYDSSRGGY